MSRLQLFERINIPVPKEGIYRRLGSQKGITKLTIGQEQEVDSYINEAVGIIELKGSARRLAVKELTPDLVGLERGVVFKSRNVADLLKGCDQILLMGATAGLDVARQIQTDISGKNVTRGVVLDAAASEMVDGCFGWIVRYFNRTLRRENLSVLPRRFSCGYGDFALENQKNIYDILELARINVRILENFILVPEKSVTAITGIKHTV